MESGVRILLLEDTESDALLIQQEVELVLKKVEFKVVNNKRDFEKSVLSFTPDLIISDYRLPNYDGLSALKFVEEKSPEIPVIIATGSINEDTAVKCMKEGAVDYVLKDHIKRLGPSVLSALEQKRIRLEYEKGKKKLIESEEKYRFLIENLNELVVKVDEKGNLIFVSQSYCKTFGKTEEELIGKSFTPLVHPDDLQSTLEEMKKLNSPPYTCYVEQRSMTSNGWRWFGWSDRAILNEKNEIISIIGVGRDITVQKETVVALRNSEMQLRMIAETAPVGIVLSDENEKTMYTNNKFMELFGYSNEEMKSVQNWWNLAYPDETYREKIKKVWANAMVVARKERVDVKPIEASVTCKDGTVKDIEFRLSSTGKLNIIILSDVTERKIAAEELQKQKDFFEQMFSQSSVSTQILDKDGWCEKINAKLSEIFGVMPEHIEGKVYNIFKDEEVKRKGITKYLEKVFKEGKTAEWEVNFDIGTAADSQDIIVSEKKKVWYENWAYPIFDKNKKLSRVIVQHTDVTRRKEIEKSLRESEERFKSIYNNSSVGLYRTTPDGTILMANPAVISMLGFNSVDELLQRNLEKNGFNEEYPRSKFKEILEKEGEVIGFETEWERKDKTKVFVRESAKAVKDETGKILYYEGTVEDITKRKIAELELKNYRIHLEKLVEERTIELKSSEERYRLLTDLSEDAITRFDRNQICIYANPAIKKQTGISHEEIIGKNISEFPIHKDYKAESQKLLQSVFENGKTIRIEFQSEAEIWIDAVIIPEYDKKGNIETVLSYGRDVTERKRIEESVLKMLQKEKEINEIKTNFISMASHEFRTPLAAILSSSDILKMYLKENLNEKILNHLSQIDNSVASMTLLLDEVLNLNRTERGMIEFNPQEINFYQLCSLIVENGKRISESKQNINFNYNLKSKIIDADQTLLEHILHNLMSNAVKFTPEDGKISFEVDQIKDDIAIKISDTGIGIIEDELNSIFEPFFRGSNVKYIKGTGMGLSVVKRFIELHKGKISINSKPGKGTIVLLTLPMKY